MKMKVKKGAVQRREGKGLRRTTSAKTAGWGHRRQLFKDQQGDQLAVAEQAKARAVEDRVRGLGVGQTAGS